MKARDVMISPVVTATEGAIVREFAETLLDKRISAVPVVDHAGKLVGIVTESDLLHRVEASTERRHSWWLQAFAGDTVFAADYVKSHAVKIRDIMTRKVITAVPETPLHEIAELLETHRIKRVPIVSEGGDLVGIVSRANLIQAVASAHQTKQPRTSAPAAIASSIAPVYACKYAIRAASCMFPRASSLSSAAVTFSST